MAALDIHELTASLNEARAPWIPRITPQSLLGDDGKKALLGVVFSRADLALR